MLCGHLLTGHCKETKRCFFSFVRAPDSRGQSCTIQLCVRETTCTILPSILTKSCYLLHSLVIGLKFLISSKKIGVQIFCRRRVDDQIETQDVLALLEKYPLALVLYLEFIIHDLNSEVGTAAATSNVIMRHLN